MKSDGFSSFLNNFRDVLIDDGFNVSNKYKSNLTVFWHRKIENLLYDIYLEYKNGLNYRNGAGVTIITPKQVVSSLLDLNHYFHDETFVMIDSIIYEDVWFKDLRCQNIEIRYSFSEFGDSVLILCNVPVPINSSQKRELENINFEIKKFSEKTGIEINVCYSIHSYRNIYKDLDLNIDCDFDDDFDKLLNMILVDDNCLPKYQDKYLIGKENSGLVDLSFDFSYEKIQLLLYEYLNDMVSYYKLEIEDIDWLKFLNMDETNLKIDYLVGDIKNIIYVIEKYNSFFKNYEDLAYYKDFFLRVCIILKDNYELSDPKIRKKK